MSNADIGLKGLGFGSLLYQSIFQNLGSICTMEAFSHQRQLKHTFLLSVISSISVCVCMCVCERETERKKESVCVLLRSKWGSLCESSSFDLWRICRSQKFSSLGPCEILFFSFSPSIWGHSEPNRNWEIINFF